MHATGSFQRPEGHITAIDLLRKAAEAKGAKLLEGANRAYTEPLATIIVDDDIAQKLEAAGIKRQPRPDGRGTIFTLVDIGPQHHTPGWSPSNFWNVLRDDPSQPFDMRFELSAALNINEAERGIVFSPLVHCKGVSASDPLPRLRMFKALSECIDEAPTIVRELAASEVIVVLHWTDLGLGGIRSVSTLFNEFCGKNNKLKEFASRERLFQPDPYPPHGQPADELYVAEPFQPALFKTWREQLHGFSAQIAV